MAINGTVGNDNLSGTTGDDLFRLHQGGDDTATGDDGADKFRMDAAFTADDSIDGGTGHDLLTLKGDYSAGVVFGAATMTNVEVLRLGGPFTYDLTTHDATVAAGEMLTVKAAKLGAGQHIVFDGSDETDGKFAVHASAGDDTVTGGAGLDRLYLAKGGDDTAYGGGGRDRFYMGSSLDVTDSINGGAAFDALILDGVVGGDNLNFNATTMTGIDRIVLNPGFIFSITTHDANIAAGELLYVVGVNAGNGFSGFKFDASAETDGIVQIVGSNQADQLFGGTQGDVFDMTAGGAGDSVQGNDGDDRIDLGATLGASDIIDGGDGFDQGFLNGDYAGLILDAPMMTSVEKITLAAGHDYDLTTADAVVVATDRFLLDASALGTGDNLQFSGGAETDGEFEITAGAGEASIIGGSGNDRFLLGLVAGTSDITVDGGGGIDNFFFGANFSLTHHGIDGGSGFDTLALDGDYSGGTVLSAIAPHGINNIEVVSLALGHDYVIDVVGDIAGGVAVTIDGTVLDVGNHVDVDFSDSTATVEVFRGAGGDDTVTFDANLHTGDQIDGNFGFDTLHVSGVNTADSIVFNSFTLNNFEKIVLDGNFNGDLQLVDDTVAAGATLTIEGTTLAGWAVNGAAETNGSFVMTGNATFNSFVGGALADTLNGAGGTDFLTGGGGADTITGGAGNDRYVYASVGQSTSTGYDTITDFNANEDQFDLPVGVSAITFTNASVSAATFDANMGSAISDNVCYVISVTGGDLIGHTILFVDGVGGGGGYQAGADYIFDITGFTGTIDTSDFI